MQQSNNTIRNSIIGAFILVFIYRAYVYMAESNVRHAYENAVSQNQYEAPQKEEAKKIAVAALFKEKQDLDLYAIVEKINKEMKQEIHISAVANDSNILVYTKDWKKNGFAALEIRAIKLIKTYELLKAKNVKHVYIFDNWDFNEKGELMNEQGRRPDWFTMWFKNELYEAYLNKKGGLVLKKIGDL